MEIIEIIPENEDGIKNLERRVAYVKAFLIYSAVSGVKLSDVDKEKLLDKIYELLDRSDHSF